MIKRILEFFNKPKFPKTVDQYWPCGSWMDAKVYNKLYCLMPYFDYSNKGNYVDYKTGNIVPLHYKELWVAYYKIIKTTRNRYGSDRAGYDDGYTYDMKLHSVKKVTQEQLNELLKKVTPTKED